MTKAEQTAKRLDQILQEHLDGHLLIGFHPGTNEPILCLDARDSKVELALQAMLHGVMAQGGIGGLKAQMQRNAKPDGDGAEEPK